MRWTALLAVLALSTTPACYLGRTKSTKTSAYVVNGMMVAVGVVALTANAGASGTGAVGLLATALVAGGLIGIGATALPSTVQDPEPDPEPRAAMTGTVTAPSLTPAIVQIR